MNRKGWTKSIGDRGARVRLYEKYPGGPLMRSVFINGREVRKSFGHRDKEKALRQGYELLTALLSNDTALDEQSLTLGLLADLYLESPAHLSKKARTQLGEGRMLRQVVRFLGPTRRVETLSESDVTRYTMARRQGAVTRPDADHGRAVGDRTIHAELEVLMRALRWATRERQANGRRVLQENPLFGVRLPREKNPKRPVMLHDTYLRLLDVAERVHPLFRLGLIVAEGTGRRLSAWRNLLWGDVDLDAGTIHWRAEHDKKGFEQVVPMSEAVKHALTAARVAQGAIGNTPVFPAPKNPAQACSRELMDGWLRRAFQLAELTPPPQGLWHSIRRKWASERKGYPVKDVAAAGGWRDTETLLRSYMQVDAETVRQVVLHPTQRLVSR